MAYSYRNSNNDALLAAAIQQGNVSVPGGGSDGVAENELELIGLSAATREIQEKHAIALRNLEVQKRLRTINVSTKDDEVKLQLRALGQPICLFGERAMERRERLKTILAEQEVDAEIFGTAVSKSSSSNFAIRAGSTAYISQNKQNFEPRQTKAFFSEASDDLIVARQAISASSWAKAQNRLIKEWKSPVSMINGASININSKLTMVASLNEPRPISNCSFSDNNSVITASFDEKCRVYSSSGDYGLLRTLVGHTQRVCDANFHPSNDNFVSSGSAEGEVRIWKGEVTSSVLSGHVQRVGRLAWDPTGNWLVSTSYDRTWRLWDIQTSKSLLIQDGYAREVYACAFHPDGSLLCTTDLGAACVIWDLRSGRITHTFNGHVLGILSANFSPNGYHLATSGLDNQVRVWDLRKKECAQIIPAHLRTVTSCRFSKDDGSCLLTASHDRSLRAWSTKDWRKLDVLIAHEGPIFGMDVDAKGKIVTVGHDRAVKFAEIR
jgi:U4/U6 small nuclear ribonucleoprotein PRP4